MSSICGDNGVCIDEVVKVVKSEKGPRARMWAGGSCIYICWLQMNWANAVAAYMLAAAVC